MQRTCQKCGHVSKATAQEERDACPQCNARYEIAARKAARSKGVWKTRAALAVVAVLLAFTAYDNVWGTAAKVRKQEAARKVEQAYRPAAPAVSNSGWDGSVHQVERYLKSNLKDPASLEVIAWSPVAARPEGGFQVRVKYRAKNSFGGYALEEKLFHLDSTGSVIGVSSV